MTGTLMIDTVATGYFSRRHFTNTAAAVNDLEEASVGAKREHSENLRIHPHASHEHAHGASMVVNATASDDGDSQLICNCVISKVIR